MADVAAMEKLAIFFLPLPAMTRPAAMAVQAGMAANLAARGRNPVTAEQVEQVVRGVPPGWPVKRERLAAAVITRLRTRRRMGADPTVPFPETAALRTLESTHPTTGRTVSLKNLWIREPGRIFFNAVF